MARYRHKDETDLGWNKIRRRINAEVNMALADVGEEIKNVALWNAWEEYSKAIAKGEPIPEVEGRYTKLVRAIVSDAIPRIVEASSVEPPVE